MSTKKEVTVVIPVGPYHTELVGRAINSAQHQAQVVVVDDRDGLGTGWARNQGLDQVRTPWVLFLDADDWLAPDAVEEYLKVAKSNPGKYVYSDWKRSDGVYKEAPQTGYAWCAGSWHVVTALVPTDWAREVGGFDEGLDAAEDTDFYLKLVTSDRCGVRCPKPLLNYTLHGARSEEAHRTGRLKTLTEEIRERYKDMGDGCCGSAPLEIETSDVKKVGDILVKTLWGGNRRVHGQVSGRRYPRSGNGKTLWVDARDAAARPDLFEVVDAAEAPSEQMRQQARVPHGVHELGEKVMKPRHVAYSVPLVDIRPKDIDHIIRLGREGLDGSLS